MSTPTLEARIAHLEGAFVQVGDRLNSIDRRLDSLESRFESRFDRLTAQMDQRFTWLTGIVVGTWITTILAVLFHH